MNYSWGCRSCYRAAGGWWSMRSGRAAARGIVVLVVGAAGRWLDVGWWSKAMLMVNGSRWQPVMVFS
ncbi:conserved hypothetical protein [Ricinus communis]|uniref:Uncharacterized protein n=1 Tax=Ricinus communis TaxID=3988 RepID=B9SD42_RICCO|nr:conserved hypothetical protein [Ricinus communis]